MNENEITQAKQNLEGLLKSDKFRQALADVAPKHITPNRIVKIALIAASRQPRLFECTPQSLLQSVMKSAELGLDCVGTLGQGYLVPYYNGKIKAYECQFIPGYQGLIALARRSGQIVRIESRVVHEKDVFDFEYGLDQRLKHVPELSGDRGKISCVYAIAELKDGSRQLEVMTIDEVEAIRDRSKAKECGPWVTDFAEMARKTVVRRIAKYLPLSPEMEQAFEADNDGYDFASHAIAANMQAGVEGLKKRIESKTADDAPQATDSPEQEPVGDEVPVTGDDMPNPVDSDDPELEAKKAEQVERLAQAEAQATGEPVNLF